MLEVAHRFPDHGMQVRSACLRPDTQWEPSGHPRQIPGIWVCLKMVSTPLYPMVNDHYPYVPNGFADHYPNYPVFKWLFHWEYNGIYPTFSDKPISQWLQVILWRDRESSSLTASLTASPVNTPLIHLDHLEHLDIEIVWNSSRIASCILILPLAQVPF